MSKELKITNNQELDNSLKNVKVGEVSSALNLSENEVQTKDLTVDGKLTVNGAIEGALRTEDDMSIDFGGDELFFINKGERVVTFKHISETIPSFIVHGANGSLVDFFSLLCSSNGATTISTEDADGEEADLIINADGYVKVSSASGEDITLNVGASGEIVIQENSGTYTPTADNHVATKKYVDDNAGGTVVLNHTWGGQMPRPPASATGKHQPVPVSYNNISFSMGTGSSPDTSLDISTINGADHLNSCLVWFIQDITITGIRFSYAQGASNNTTHVLHLMRYDISVIGDLSNGVIVGTATDSNSDDYATRRHTGLTVDTNYDDISTSQVLMATIETPDATNAALSCIAHITYTVD